MTLPRRTANAALAAWVCAASTCSAVAHAHDGGDRPHSHHLGLTAVADAAPADRTPLGDAVPHWHVILLGVESGGLPVESGDGRDAPPLDPHAAAVGAPDVGAPVPDGVGTPVPPVPDLTGPFAGQLPAVIDPPLGGSPPTAPDLHSTCPKAALARSGVRLA